jgi:hypothetical protein
MFNVLRKPAQIPHPFRRKFGTDSHTTLNDSSPFPFRASAECLCPKEQSQRISMMATVFSLKPGGSLEQNATHPSSAA